MVNDVTSRMPKNPPRLSFRGAAGDEESRPDQIGVSRERFLAEFTLSGQSEILRCAQDDSEGLGMTMFAKVFQHPARAVASRARRRAVQRSDGYSLLQILITLAVVSTLAAMALPTTRNALRNYRLTAAVASASGAIAAARYQAIMRSYPYNLTFNSTNATYQVASEPPPATTFTNVGGAVPLSGVGDVTINRTTVLQFNANGTVSATTGTLSLTISNGLLTKTINVTGVGDVSSN